MALDEVKYAPYRTYLGGWEASLQREFASSADIVRLLEEALNEMSPLIPATMRDQFKSTILTNIGTTRATGLVNLIFSGAVKAAEEGKIVEYIEGHGRYADNELANDARGTSTADHYGIFSNMDGSSASYSHAASAWDSMWRETYGGTTVQFSSGNVYRSSEVFDAVYRTRAANPDKPAMWVAAVATAGLVGDKMPSSAIAPEISFKLTGERAAEIARKLDTEPAAAATTGIERSRTILHRNCDELPNAGEPVKTECKAEADKLLATDGRSMLEILKKGLGVPPAAPAPEPAASSPTKPEDDKAGVPVAAAPAAPGHPKA